MTPTERQRRNHAVRQHRLAQGGVEREQELATTVRGESFTYWADTVRQLKREGRNDEALNLLRECVAAAEIDATFWQGPPAPWYTEQVAMILHRLGDHTGEIEALQRYERAAGPTNPLHDRLAKAKQRGCR